MGNNKEILATKIAGMLASRSGIRRARHTIVVAAMLALPLSGCGRQDKAVTPSPDTNHPAFKAVASIKELMDSTVDPSADGVWDAVGIVSTAAGVDKHQPRTDEEWHEVRRHAMTLIESMNLLVMPDRRTAPAGSRAGLGEQAPEQIDAAIKGNRLEFNQFAGAVRDTTEEALKAIDHKDPVALTRIGGDLDQRCEGCHVTFWYPNSARPIS